MQGNPFRSLPVALLCGLLLVACNASLEEAAPEPSEEAQGTYESAVCTGLSVTSLTIQGASVYQGELGASGNWAVSTGSNAVQLEYYIDNVQYVVEQRVGTSGTWYFSYAGVACGTHTFLVKAYPMVIDSAGNRALCVNSPRSVSQSVSGEACCVPRTCASVGAVCGSISDGCGGTLNCGRCTGSGVKCFSDGTWYYAGQHCSNGKCVSNTCDL